MSLMDTDVGPTADGIGSFEEFVAATGPRLYRTALLLCGDHHRAEDLTQTTYAKLFASWRRVSKADHPVAYARTTLTRTFISERRLRRNSELPTDELPERTVEPADPGMRVDLFAALGKLEREERLLVVMRYWDDLSVAQTAELLGLSDSAVRQRSRRALARLRALLPGLTIEGDQ